MRSDDLRRLQALAALIQDARLAEVRRAASALAQCEAQFSALEPGGAEGLDALTEAQVAARHAVWAGMRRAALMPVRAERLAALDAARDAAARAVGRAQVLDRLGPRG